jgi:hypothetical protein
MRGRGPFFALRICRDAALKSTSAEHPGSDTTATPQHGCQTNSDRWNGWGPARRRAPTFRTRRRFTISPKTKEPEACPRVVFSQMCKHIGSEEDVRKSRYIVLNHHGVWQIKNAGSCVTATFPSKAQALCAAIELAEQEGVRGHSRSSCPP